jgi:hypothetical protein
MALTPNAAAYKAVFDLMVQASRDNPMLLPTPSFDEDVARPTELALNTSGSRTEAWLNVRPGSSRYLFSEVGTQPEIQHREVSVMIEWVVIGKGTTPGTFESPRRDRFDAGLAALRPILAGPRLITLEGIGFSYLRLADDAVSEAGEQSILAALPNVTAASVEVIIYMAVPSELG